MYFCYRKRHFGLSEYTFAVFKNLKSGSPGLPVESVRAYWFFVWHDFFFFLFFSFLISWELGSFYVFLETRRLLGAHLQIKASIFDFRS